VLEPDGLVVGGERVPFRRLAAAGGVELETRLADDPPGLRLEVTLRNPGRAEVVPGRVGMVVPASLAQVLEHGWQSWSVVRRCSPTDRRPERASSPGLVKRMHLADPDSAGETVNGDQFLLWDAGVAGFLAGGRHLSTVEARPDGLVAWALLDSTAIAPGAELQLDPLWISGGEPGPLYSAYAERWGATGQARPAATAPTGWCSWYHYFDRVTPRDVDDNTRLASSHRLGMVQIDDGWQAAIGDWTRAAPGWPGGTAAAAGRIRARGLTPGLWTAPFLVAENSAVAGRHPDWLVRRPDGLPVRSAYNPQWGGWAHALDTTHPGALDYLRSTFTALRAEGFDYHKIDFCYAAAAPGLRHDGSATRAGALRLGLQAVRDGIGDDAFLLGCGCPFGPAVGVVDAMRVSADVAPTWASEHRLAGFDETLPSLRNALAATLLRAPLHRRLWANDPDCLMLRPTQTGLEPWQRRLQAAVVAGTGGFAIVSDDLALLGDDEWETLEMVVSAGSDQPLDIEDPFADPLRITGRSTALVASADAGGQLPPGGGRTVLEASGPGGAARLVELDRA